MNENLGWGATMWTYSARPPDPALRLGWREMRLEALRWWDRWLKGAETGISGVSDGRGAAHLMV